jgi:hypothetical protein
VNISKNLSKVKYFNKENNNKKFDNELQHFITLEGDLASHLQVNN